MLDYYDITNWTQEPKKFREFITGKKETKADTELISPIAVDTVKLYALLKATVSNYPNGFHTFVQQGLPLDNMIWWDFVLECDKGFISIWRTSHVAEAIVHFEGGDFNLSKFIHANISSKSELIEKTIATFEKYSVYINHYKSYKDCVEYLWKEISMLNLESPISPERHLVDESNYKSYFDGIKLFAENSVKFHTLGKSLVLNAAFEVEAFLNLVIRVGSISEVRNYPDIIKKYLASTFADKLKNLKFYSKIMSADIDLGHSAVKDTLELMNLRNKYVHSDETSAHNKISEVFFDGNFPLQQTSKDAPAIEALKQVFYRPDFKSVKKSYDTAKNFVSYIESLFFSEHKEEMILALSQNPIGYNEHTKSYSIVFNQLAPDFYLSEKPD